MNLNDIQIKIDKPYPEIVDAKEDRQTVAVLKNLASSRQSELTAVLQYIYQSVIANRVDKDIADIFEEIGVVEMMHLDMLMHAIVDFGGIPQYEDAMGNFFNANSVSYALKLKDMLDVNIRDEQDTILAYEAGIKKVKNQSLIDLFKRIIEDEQRHLEIFKYLRDNVRFLSV